jgi:hypothetical protein
VLGQSHKEWALKNHRKKNCTSTPQKPPICRRWVDNSITGLNVYTFPSDLQHNPWPLTTLRLEHVHCLAQGVGSACSRSTQDVQAEKRVSTLSFDTENCVPTNLTASFGKRHANGTLWYIRGCPRGTSWYTWCCRCLFHPSQIAPETISSLDNFLGAWRRSPWPRGILAWPRGTGACSIAPLDTTNGEGLQIRAYQTHLESVCCTLWKKVLVVNLEWNPTTCATGAPRPPTVTVVTWGELFFAPLGQFQSRPQATAYFAQVSRSLRTDVVSGLELVWPAFISSPNVVTRDGGERGGRRMKGLQEFGW